MLTSCARESKTRTGGFLKGKLVSNHGLFSFHEESQREQRAGRMLGAFYRDANGFGRLDADLRVSCTSSRPRPQWTSVQDSPLFLNDAELRNLGLFLNNFY